MKKILSIFLLYSSVCLAQAVVIPDINISPNKQVCYFTNDIITVDGVLNEPVWNKIEWTGDFVDIRGTIDNTPRYKSKVKFLWDNDYFYVGAELEEPNLWGILTQHDTIIYNNNNFEVFIDPDGDAFCYAEVEMNTLNTIWDLLLIKPYRDMKKGSITNWDMKGFKHAVAVYGTLNKPGDKDSCWTVELAFPWDIFKELTEVPLPPRNNDQWRMNFMRIEWDLAVKNNSYIQQYNHDTGRPLRDYWVWSPQGLVNMHYPEMWGYVQFSTIKAGNGHTLIISQDKENAERFLRHIYYAERNYYAEHNAFTSDINKLGIAQTTIKGFSAPVVIECISDMFKASLTADNGEEKVMIRNDGIITTVKE